MSDNKWPTLCAPSRRLILGEARRELMSGDELDDLNVHLYKIDSFTNNIYLSSPSQVLLQENGHTEAGLRFTLPCFKKICQTLTPRLFGLLFDVASGASDQRTRSRSSLEATANPHVMAAISIYNRVVEEYFGRLEGSILMENAGTGNYDGHAFNENKVFELGSIVSIVTSMFLSAGWSALHVFVEDRFVRIVFSSPEKVEIDLIDGFDFHVGAYVDINPSWKDSSISGCRTLIRTRDGLFTSKHVNSPPSRTFDAVRTAASISTMLLAQNSNERFTESAKNNILSPMKIPLGLEAKESGGVVSDRSITKLKKWITTAGILYRHATEIANLTVCWGGSEEYAMEVNFVSPDDIEKRTWFDLAINMLRYADKIMGNQSDKIRALANEILMYQGAGYGGVK